MKMDIPRLVAIGPPPTDRREILVVDDSRTTRHMIGACLARLGYGTALCDGGGAALDLIEIRRFDLILLDLVMPDISGMRTLAEIRSSRSAELPVIMMTARGDRAAAVEALDAGADDHVTKPFDFPILAARIDALLRRAGTIAELRRINAALDARIAECAAESGELRAQLAAVHAERGRLARSMALLENEIARRRP